MNLNDYRASPRAVEHRLVIERDHRSHDGERRYRATCPCGWKGIVCWPTMSQAGAIHQRHIDEGWTR